jgi:hypothetical protein
MQIHGSAVVSHVKPRHRKQTVQTVRQIVSVEVPEVDESEAPVAVRIRRSKLGRSGEERTLDEPTEYRWRNGVLLLPHTNWRREQENSALRVAQLPTIQSFLDDPATKRERQLGDAWDRAKQIRGDHDGAVIIDDVLWMPTDCEPTWTIISSMTFASVSIGLASRTEPGSRGHSVRLDAIRERDLLAARLSSGCEVKIHDEAEVLIAEALVRNPLEENVRKEIEKEGHINAFSNEYAFGVLSDERRRELLSEAIAATAKGLVEASGLTLSAHERVELVRTAAEAFAEATAALRGTPP